MITIQLFLFVLALGVPVISDAQSLYDMNGHKIATKINGHQLNVTGTIFTLKNGQLIETFDGEWKDDLGVNKLLKEEDQVNYYNMQDNRVGYYIPSEKRYYQVNTKGNKENHVALLHEGLVYTIDENPTFKVDPGFDPELIGVVLFFFLGY